MSLDKAIKYGKEHRKEYRGAKSICCSCRNHGSCSWCEANRRYQALKEETRTLDELDEYDKDAIYDLLGYKEITYNNGSFCDTYNNTGKCEHKKKKEEL